MNRRDFLRWSGVGLGVLAVPGAGRSVTADGRAATAGRKQLADVALEQGRDAGASYVDVRIGRYLNQFVFTRENKVENVVDTESYGAGVRVLAAGTWGFAATNRVTKDSIADAARRAVSIAKANAKIQREPVRLAPVEAHGQVSWRTPILKNAFDIPLAEKVDLLLAVNSAAMKAGADFVNSNLFMVNERKYFASTEGSYIDQDVHRIWPTFTVTAIDSDTGRFQTRNALSSPIGQGWEYLEPSEDAKIPGPTVRYRERYDMLEDARAAARQAREKHSARSVEPGKYDLVLDPTHLFLTIHESVGHPLELDRVLGYEANYAGTSFATLDKWRTKKFAYGSKIVNFVADKTQPGSLGAVGWDDEGVRSKSWHLVKDGMLVNYQATRDQVHVLGENASHGCCYADSWNSIQFQRMPNVSLSAGTGELTVDEMIRDVERGIFICGRGSYSIDQQRYNFQFGGQLFYLIEAGKITGMLRDVAYQSNTTEFWNSCVGICDQRDYRLGGTFFDGKGQPSQVSAVSHGCATTRFRDVSVINTGRKL